MPTNLVELSGVAAMFELLKAGPSNRSSLRQRWKDGGRTPSSFDPSLYPLIDRGILKKEKKGDEMIFSIAPGHENETFNPPRMNQRKGAKKADTALAVPTKRPYHRKTETAIAFNPPAAKRHDKADSETSLMALEQMAQAHSAINTLQNSVAAIKFAMLLDRHGPEQMLLMLAGLDNLPKR
jgi:hypothetical protein